MPKLESLGRFMSAVLATVALAAIAFGQNASPTQNGAPAQGRSRAAGPVTMTECEGTNNCANWTFLGTQGNGQWPSGEVANLTVERFDADSVVIQRADSTGPTAGLTAVYTGTRHGNRIGGEYTSSWPGHWSNQQGNWYATIGKAQVSLPMVMHFCIHCEEGKGSTLKWENGHYVDVTPGGGPPGGNTYTVESFTRDSVIMHRTMYGTYQGTAVLTGQISENGDSVVNGIHRWDGQPDNVHSFHMAWGAAIDTVPGNHRPDPVVIARPVVCYGWFFVVCE